MTENPFAADQKVVKSGKVKTKKVTPEALAPDMAVADGMTKRTKYWYGAMPDSPIDPIHVAGITFAKVMEVLSIGPGNETLRSAYLGCCSELTSEQTQAFAKALPRLVMRTVERAIGGMSDGTQDTEVKDPTIIRTGHILRIPSDDEVVAMKERGNYRPYVRQPGDRPVSDFIFFIRQDMRGAEYPAPVSQTGIEILED